MVSVSRINMCYFAEWDKCWWKVLDVNRPVTGEVLLQHWQFQSSRLQSPPPHIPQTVFCRTPFRGICAHSGSLPSMETGKRLSSYFWLKSWGFDQFFAIYHLAALQWEWFNYYYEPVSSKLVSFGTLLQSPRTLFPCLYFSWMGSCIATDLG